MTTLRLPARRAHRFGERVVVLGLRQNAVSYHLKLLRAARLLRDHEAAARDIYNSQA